LLWSWMRFTGRNSMNERDVLSRPKLPLSSTTVVSSQVSYCTPY
jgi:hypothetical protein